MAKPFSLRNAFAALFVFAALVALAPASAAPVGPEDQNTLDGSQTLQVVPPAPSTSSSHTLVPDSANVSPPSSVCPNGGCGPLPLQAVPLAPLTSSSPTLVPDSGNVSPPSPVCPNAGCEESHDESQPSLSAEELQREELQRQRQRQWEFVTSITTVVHQLQTEFNSRIQTEIASRIHEFLLTRLKSVIDTYFSTMRDVLNWAVVDIDAIHPWDGEFWRNELSRASGFGTNVYDIVNTFWTNSLPGSPRDFPFPDGEFTSDLAILYLVEVLVKPIQAVSQLELSRLNLADVSVAEKMEKLIVGVYNAVEFVLKLKHSDDFPKYATSVDELKTALAQSLPRGGTFTGDISQSTAKDIFEKVDAVDILLEENAGNVNIMQSDLQELYHAVASILHYTASRGHDAYIYTPSAAAELPATLSNLRKLIIQAVDMEGEEPLVKEAVDMEGEEPLVKEAVDMEGEEPLVKEAVDMEGEEPLVKEAVDMEGEEPLVKEEPLRKASKTRRFSSLLQSIMQPRHDVPTTDISDYLNMLFLWTDRMLAARSLLDMAAIKRHITTGQTSDTEPNAPLTNRVRAFAPLTNRVRAFKSIIEFYVKNVDRSVSVAAATKLDELVRYINDADNIHEDADKIHEAIHRFKDEVKK